MLSIVHSFSSVAYVLVHGAKTTGPIEKKFGFLNQIFSSFGTLPVHVLTK
jgi:hypothetical protein